MSYYQIITPIISIAYLLVVFVLRSIVIRRKSGVSPFVFGSTEKAHDYLGLVYKLAVALLTISIALFSFSPAAYELLNPIEYFPSEQLSVVGLVLLILSFIWTLIAQIQMSTSWRIGINYEEKTELIEKGLFSISRNPVFLGVVVFFIGIFFILPNTLSFALILVMLITVQVQVRLEEEYLEKIHGDKYKEYMTRIRRWL